MIPTPTASMGLAGFLLAQLVAALPQDAAIPPSPTESRGCTFHQDHWDCDGPACQTKTSTILEIQGTITNYPEWLTSMNSAYSTSGVTFSGTRVFIHTSLYSYPGGSFTGYGVYDSNALTSAGYSLKSTTSIITTCPTATLPPSPTGSMCSPHGDHWHCDATSSESGPAPTGVCEPHDDHWHCPPGVPEPTTSPPKESSKTTPPGPSETCEPHGDHWHCPPGVKEPTSKPGPSDGPAPTGGPESCEPHGDHWHCPPGVKEPATKPGGAGEPKPTGGAGVCEPHGDHWHCPPGVKEPGTPPPPEASRPSDPLPSPTSNKPIVTAGASQAAPASAFAAALGLLGAVIALV